MGIGMILEARRKDGSLFPVEIGLSAIETASEKLAVAFVTDVTERLAQERVQQANALAAKLFTAQEEERRRISRELHDQICQQLAALAIDIGGLSASPPSPEDSPKRFKELQSRVVKASEQARHFAYELHPSVLDDLGLTASIGALCKEFSDQHPDIALEFNDGTVPASVPLKVASCVYRVAQASLQNVGKHSKASHVSVSLGFKEDAVVLTIADDGVGFDLEAIKGRVGLGLIGAEERARLLNGTFTVASQQGHGTRITLEIPSPGKGP
jgi:signal transduction histidine kinase